MNRINLLYKMDGLLEICKACKKPYATPEIKCKGCSTYDELREIGNQLGRENKVAKKLELSVEEFVDLHYVQKLGVKEIASLKGIKPNAISNWKWMYKDKIEEARKTLNLAEMKPKPTPKTKPIKEDKTAEYKALIEELQAKVQGQEELIAALNLTIKKYENINDACEDVENELVSLREERDSYLNQLLDTRHKYHNLDYTIENQKKALENANKTLQSLTKENQVLRDLAKANAMVQLEIL